MQSPVLLSPHAQADLQSLNRMLKKSTSRTGSGQVPFLLAEQRRGWSLMIFLCSRNARPQKALVGRAQ